MTKRIVSIFLVLTLLLGFAAYLPTMSVSAAADGTGYYKVNTSSTGLNMRSGAGQDYGVVVVVPKGTVLYVTELSGIWGKTTYSGNSGWISLDYANKVDYSSGAIDILAGLDKLREKFPDGKYWNHYGLPERIPDGWTETPCPSGHYLDGVQQCNGQCDGFARKLGLDLFGLSTYSWEKLTTLSGLCVGDLIRYNSKHTIMVVGFSSDSNIIYVADCNWDYHCGIDWDRSFSISRYISSFYVLHYPGNSLNRAAYLAGQTSSGGVTTTTAATTTTTTTAAPTTTTTTAKTTASTTKTTAAPTTTTISDGFVSDVPNGITTTTAAAELALSETAITLTTGGTHELTVTPAHTIGVSWSSSDPTVATVDSSGLVKAIASGNAVITVTLGSASAQCAVTVRRATVVRLSGDSRVSTAVAIAHAGWSQAGADNVIICSATNFADALAGVPLAKALNAPILLTMNGKSGLENAVSEELVALGVKNVYLLGGSGAVGAGIGDRLKGLGLSVVRISGNTRYETAVAIAEKLSELNGSHPNEVFFAYGENYPDALAAGTVAALLGSPILYAPSKGELDVATSKYAADCDASRATVLGGTATISEETEQSIEKCGFSRVTRISGKDRFETSLRICDTYDHLFDSDDLSLATAYSYPDALAGGAYAAKLGIPVVLTGAKTLSADMQQYIAGKDMERIYVFGGTGTVSDATVELFAK